MYGRFGSIHDAQAAFDQILVPNLVSWNTLIKAYGHCGYLEDASRVFCAMPRHDVVSWTSLITAATHHGKAKEGLQWFFAIQVEDLQPNRVTFRCALDACAKLLALNEGLEIHAAILIDGHERDVVLATALIILYGRCGCVDDARRVLSHVACRDVVMYNAAIRMFVYNGLGNEGLDTFQRMHSEGFLPSKVTFLHIADACAGISVQEGRKLQIAICEGGHAKDISLRNTLIHMYGKCKSISDAYIIFNNISFQDTVTWNVMISTLAQSGQEKEALGMFCKMQARGIQSDKVTYVNTIEVCTSISCFLVGLMVHAAIFNSGFDQDGTIGSALINMYGSCGSLSDVRRVLSSIPCRDIILWTAGIAAHLQNKESKEALVIFMEMQNSGVKPDTTTFQYVLQACADTADLKMGCVIHAAILLSGHGLDMVLGDSLIHMYGKCGDLFDARNVFSSMPQANSSSWEAIITLFAQNGQGEESLALFYKMCLGDKAPGYEPDITLANALVTMYGECGNLDDARRVFSGMHKQDCVTWTAMITAAAKNGHGKEAFNLLNQMDCEGIEANEVTFVGAFIACSHTGQVDDARQLFMVIQNYHGLQCTEDHFMCMVDILGRAGLLNEAEYFIYSMPIEKAILAWLCLLGACKIHSDIERAIRVAHHCIKLNSESAMPYDQLINLFAFSGMCEA